MKDVTNVTKTSKFNYFILFIIPILFFVTENFTIDNDFWFTIAEGKYVLQNGFPHTVPFTIYNNLDFIYQSWGTGVIFYLINKYFGLYGMLFFVIIILTIITYFYHKLCMLVSNNNKILSTIVTIVTMSLLASTFITTRPQIFTYLNLVLVLYIMGVTSIREFALPLMVGLLAGTYSSICLASEIWYLLRTKGMKKE